MQEFFKWTAWSMQTPKSYGLFHLLFLFIGGTISIISAFLLRKTTKKQNKIILLSIGTFLIITEIYKQLFYYYVIKDCEYSWWIFPFQLCSVPMYLCIFCAFCKNEKINNWLYNFMFTFNLLGGAISFSEPSGLNHPYWTLTLHAYTWHMILVFLGFYLFFSKRVCTNWKEYFKGMVIFVSCATIAQIINISFKNFGNINMFYISPYYCSPIAIFKDFYKNLGWFANMCLFLLALLIGGVFIFYICYGFRILYKKNNKNDFNSPNDKIILKILKERF